MDGIEFLWFYHLNNNGMKKIILILIAFMTLVPMADAQITIKSKSNKETLLSIRMGFITLNYDDRYYLALSTTNQFDDLMILPLGKEKKEAMSTIEALIDITTTIKKGDSVSIESIYGQEFLISWFAKNTILIHSKGYAASSNTNKAELTRILDAITFDVR